MSSPQLTCGWPKLVIAMGELGGAGERREGAARHARNPHGSGREAQAGVNRNHPLPGHPLGTCGEVRESLAQRLGARADDLDFVVKQGCSYRKLRPSDQVHGTGFTRTASRDASAPAVSGRFRPPYVFRVSATPHASRGRKASSSLSPRCAAPRVSCIPHTHR